MSEFTFICDEDEKPFCASGSGRPMSAGFRKAIGKAVTPLSLPRNHMLVEATKVAECVYFLEQGFATTYTFVKGVKRVEGFWGPGQVLMSAQSFFEQRPSQEFIQLRTKSELWCITHAGALELLDKYPEAQMIYRMIMNQYYEFSRERIRDLQSLKAMQRYEKLIRTFAGIEQYVTQEEIASYLGIAPQSFSRMKRQNRRH